MKNIAKYVIAISVLFSALFSAASFAQVPPQWSCSSTNYAQNGNWVGTAYNLGQAQQNAIGFCARAYRTQNPATCHITGCQRIGYAPPPAPVYAPAPAPVYAAQYSCTAWGWHHRVAGTASGYKLGKVASKAVRNCYRNGGQNCQVYPSPSCPIS